VAASHPEALFWILRTGVPWREVPERFGKWQAVYPNPAQPEPK